MRVVVRVMVGLLLKSWSLLGIGKDIGWLLLRQPGEYVRMRKSHCEGYWQSHGHSYGMIRVGYH